jgi:CRP/FNR family transcriptional regulator, nitrogen oxide reductase regulator
MPAPEPAAVATELKSRLLDGLARRDIEVILAAARRRHIPANSVVLNEGDPADHLFLLTKGRARFFLNTQEGKKVILFWLTPGEVIGGASILSIPCRYLVSTETVKDSTLLVWDRATIRKFAVRYPRLLENAILIAYDYFAWYVADHVALVSHTARQRLASVLIYLAEAIGKKMGNSFEFDATNEELASAANVTQFTASRLLSEWQKNRALIKSRGKILLQSPERLFLRVE